RDAVDDGVDAVQVRDVRRTHERPNPRETRDHLRVERPVRRVPGETLRLPHSAFSRLGAMRSRRGALIGMLAVAALVGAARGNAATYALGVDVSHYQGAINWPQVA